MGVTGQTKVRDRHAERSAAGLIPGFSPKPVRLPGVGGCGGCGAGSVRLGVRVDGGSRWYFRRTRFPPDFRHRVLLGPARAGSLGTCEGSDGRFLSRCLLCRGYRAAPSLDATAMLCCEGGNQLFDDLAAGYTPAADTRHTGRSSGFTKHLTPRLEAWTRTFAESAAVRLWSNGNCGNYSSFRRRPEAGPRGPFSPAGRSPAALLPVRFLACDHGRAGRGHRRKQEDLLPLLPEQGGAGTGGVR